MRRYGRWAGNPAGSPEMPDRCIVEVHDIGRSVLFHQCGNKRSGSDKLCGVHRRQKKLGKQLLIPRDKK